MKKLLILTLFLFLATSLLAKDFTARVTIGNWNGLDSVGALELSIPVAVKVYNSATNTLLTQTTANGPVTNLVMPDFIIPVPDNTSVKLKVYATVTDAAGNVSAKSADSNEVTLIGIDTHPPAGINTITITIQ